MSIEMSFSCSNKLLLIEINNSSEARFAVLRLVNQSFIKSKGQFLNTLRKFKVNLGIKQPKCEQLLYFLQK